MSFSDNYENYVCELGGFDIPYIAISAVLVLLIKNRCNPNLRHGGKSNMKIELCENGVWCTL